MKKLTLSLLLLVTFSSASFFDFFGDEGVKKDTSIFSEENIGRTIIQKAKKYNIDPRKLFTIASIESNFNPFAIAIETSKKKAEILKGLRSDRIKIQTGRTYHSRIWLVSVFPKDYRDAVLIIEQLEKLRFGFDVGLMQINTVNFALSEVKEMMKPDKNIDKAAKILKSCIRQFKSEVHQIECYNRGAGNLRKMLRGSKRYYPYYTRYKRHRNKHF